MSCKCFTVKFEKLTESFSVKWERFCDTLVDLVPFNSLEGRFLTKEGYTILVKI